MVTHNVAEVLEERKRLLVVGILLHGSWQIGLKFLEDGHELGICHLLPNPAFLDHLLEKVFGDPV